MQALIAGAKSFSRLKMLVVSQSHLTPADVKALKQAFPNVTLDAKNQKYDDLEPDRRYVSIGE